MSRVFVDATVNSLSSEVIQDSAVHEGCVLQERFHSGGAAYLFKSLPQR